MIKNIIIFCLKHLAKNILNKYNPRIIGITGSVGKTGAREAIFSVVKSKFRARRSLKNYNNEFGVPLSIIGAVKSPGKNILGWAVIFFSALKLLTLKNRDYPEILILEMGVDKPFDMDYLNSIVSCDVAVLTGIGEAHLENFSSREKLASEKAKIFFGLKKNGWAILNFDNEKAVKISDSLKNRIISYGFSENANVRASNLVFKFSDGDEKVENLSGLSFKINYGGSIVPAVLPKVLGKSAAYAALAGASVGIALGFNLADIAVALNGFEMPAGRMKLIKGIKNTVIIDDTYNASPESCSAAIDFVSKIETVKKFRRVAIFGDMLELGSYSEEGHALVGRALAGAGFDLVITVGERSRDIVRGALRGGLKEDKIFNFANNLSAGKFAQDRIKQGDLILIKGSQGARMEKIVLELMDDPLLADKLLCRQEKEWI